MSLDEFLSAVKKEIETKEIRQVEKEDEEK